VYTKLGPDGNTVQPIGVSGLKIYGRDLYFTNSGQGTLTPVEDDAKGNKAGEIEALARLPLEDGVASLSNAFDFAMDDCGKAYITNCVYQCVKITRNRDPTTWVNKPESDTTLFGPTSAAISKDENTVYLKTGGITLNCTA
jgi:hypothetical protein